MSLYWRKYTIDIPSNGAHHGGEKRGNFSVIGFQKALDTLEWRFIKKILELCNFGENVKKWVRIVYANIESAVMNNGFATIWFKPTRGIRQGCPLSPNLFILGAEILSNKLRQTAEIKGINLFGNYNDQP